MDALINEEQGKRVAEKTHFQLKMQEMQAQLEMLEAENEMLQDSICQIRDKRSVVQRHIVEMQVV
jgi:hypothetical protein